MTFDPECDPSSPLDQPASQKREKNQWIIARETMLIIYVLLSFQNCLLKRTWFRWANKLRMIHVELCYWFYFRMDVSDDIYACEVS